MHAGDRFTYSEILDNVFYYTHDGSELLYDTIQLTVEDGRQSVPVVVQVTVVKTDRSAPVQDLEATMILRLPEGM